MRCYLSALLSVWHVKDGHTATGEAGKSASEAVAEDAEVDGSAQAAEEEDLKSTVWLSCTWLAKLTCGALCVGELLGRKQGRVRDTGTESGCYSCVASAFVQKFVHSLAVPSTAMVRLPSAATYAQLLLSQLPGS